MYEAYWRLDRKPFDNTADARFYYPGEAHQGALLKLRYAIENRHGGGVLAGSPGIGKTMLIRALIRELGEDYGPSVHITFPQMPPAELLAFLADELTGRSGASGSVSQSVRTIRQALVENTKAGRHAVVFVDEAQVIENREVLEALRLLLNFEVAGRPAMSLLLVAQPALLPRLDRMPGLEERMGVKCLLRNFTLEETAAYIQHRMQAAGGDASMFDAEALTAVHELTRGTPRRINRLCDLALLIGYAEEHSRVTPDTVESVSDEPVTVTAE